MAHPAHSRRTVVSKATAIRELDTAQIAVYCGATLAQTAVIAGITFGLDTARAHPGTPAQPAALSEAAAVPGEPLQSDSCAEAFLRAHLQSTATNAQAMHQSWFPAGDAQAAVVWAYFLFLSLRSRVFGVLNADRPTMK